ncbi:MAG: rRNA maturation RNase YbeY [Spirosomataceae bacterium]
MISFTSQYPSFDLKPKNTYKKWLRHIAAAHKFEIQELTYIFLSDAELLEINQTYLQHDTFTDIITFDNSEEQQVIEGDIFISVDRVKENAEKFKVPFQTELNRVIAHGLLHLCGFLDKKQADVQKMREEEEKAIQLFDQFK